MRSTGTKWERHGRGAAGFHNKRERRTGHVSDKLIIGTAELVDRKFRQWKKRRGIVEDIDTHGYGKGFTYGRASTGESDQPPGFDDDGDLGQS